MALFDLSRLQSALLNTGLQQRDNPLYQVINQLIINQIALNKQLNPSGSGTIINTNTFITNELKLSGLISEDGIDGEPGIPGISGTSGSQGPQGIQGLSGYAGMDGNDGDDSFPIPGPVGLTGSSGPSGVSGSIGPIGLDGNDGEDAIPIPGIPGPQGATGVTVIPGLSGVPGLDGIDGEDSLIIPGQQGIQGPSGVSIFDFSNQEEEIISMPFGTISGVEQTGFYEEGLWTPAVKFGGASVGVTYTLQFGQYIRIGKFVVLTGIFILSNKGSSVGAATLAGIPFINGAGFGFISGNKSSYSAFTAGVTAVGLQFASGGSVLDFVKDVAGVNTNMTNVDFTNTSTYLLYFGYIRG